MSARIPFFRLIFSVIVVLVSFVSCYLLLAAALALPRDVRPEAVVTLGLSVVIALVAGSVSACVHRGGQVHPSVPFAERLTFWFMNVLASFVSFYLVMVAIVAGRDSTGPDMWFYLAGSFIVVCVAGLVPVCLYRRQVGAAGCAVSYVMFGLGEMGFSPLAVPVSLTAAGLIYAAVRLTGGGLRRLLDRLDGRQDAAPPSGEGQQT